MSLARPAARSGRSGGGRRTALRPGSCSALWGALAAVLLAAVFLAPGFARADDSDPDERGTDDRSTERFHFSCENELGRRDVTLFANGTIRLRQGLYEDERMFLGELGREEVEVYLDLLGRPDATDDQPDRAWSGMVGGPWVEECEIHLQLEGAPEESYHFSRLDTLSLRVSHLVRLAEDMAKIANPDRQPQQLPSDYQPERGHVLRNAEGLRFRVKSFTTDLTGVELEGLDQPVVLFVSREDLPRLFFAVETPEVP